jgi:methionyl-tRNA synthetase
VGHYTGEELAGKSIVLVSNLKPAKLRGVESQGMLLAAEKEGVVDVLFIDGAEPGTPVHLEGFAVADEAPAEISIDEFFDIPISVSGHKVLVGETRLVCGNEPVTTQKVDTGKVG